MVSRRRRLACCARRSSCRSSLRLAVSRRCSLVGTAVASVRECVGLSRHRVCQLILRPRGRDPHEHGDGRLDRRVAHRVPGRHVGVQLLRAGPAHGVGRHRRRPRSARDGAAAAHSRREPADAGGGAADPRPHRPHLVGAEGRRHLRLPGVHPSRGPLHAGRPDPGLRPADRASSRWARCSASPSRWSSSTATAPCSTSAASPSPSTTPRATPAGRWCSGSSEATATLVFTGDTCSSSRWAAPTCPAAAATRLLGSIVEKLLVLDDDTLVLPGHGESSTIGLERRTNPFLEGLTL